MFRFYSESKLLSMLHERKGKLYALRAGFQLVVTAAELVCCSTLRINRIIFLAPAGGTGCSVTTCLSDDDIGQCLQRKAPMKGRKRGGGFLTQCFLYPFRPFILLSTQNKASIYKT